MARFKASEIGSIVGGTSHGEGLLEVDHLILDSRKIISANKSMFVAIVGDRHDGHQYISELYEKGSTLIFA